MTIYKNRRKRASKNKTGMPIVVAWYNETDWPIMRRIMDDEMHPTYREWLSHAIEMTDQIRARGVSVITQIIKPDEFVRFCTKRSLKKDGQARSQFAVWKATSHMRQKP